MIFNKNIYRCGYYPRHRKPSEAILKMNGELMDVIAALPRPRHHISKQREKEHQSVKSNIIIACDSTCDLNTELIERFNIKVLPLGVSLGGKEYLDGINISTYNKIQQDILSGRSY